MKEQPKKHEPPKILTSLVAQLKKKGVKDAEKVAVQHLQKSGVFLPGTTSLSDRGAVRNAMTPEQRAASRPEGLPKVSHQRQTHIGVVPKTKSTLHRPHKMRAMHKMHKG